ncbi:hypothetical protein BLOT_009230 [Blomia tropicalis]|nr:hypothetical protein BLOT_009230 [Blomia tropicalis]
MNRMSSIMQYSEQQKWLNGSKCVSDGQYCNNNDFTALEANVDVNRNRSESNQIEQSKVNLRFQIVTNSKDLGNNEQSDILNKCAIEFKKHQFIKYC